MTAQVNSVPGRAKRAGLHYWLESYEAMVRWEVLGARLVLPLLAIVQVLIGAGFVLGFGLLIPEAETAMALFLSTGAVVMTTVMMGMLVTPQIVAQRKMDGSYDFIRSLPVPRSAASMASLTMAAMVAIPGVLSAMLAAEWRYDVTFRVDASIVPALLLTLACGTFIGAAVAHGIEVPQWTMLFSQLGIFFVVGFSPISFPIERLPRWLAAAHEYLPVHHMALTIREALTEGLVEVTPRSWIVLVLWTAGTAGVNGLVLGRRR